VTAPQALDDQRVAIVNEHMRLENAYDFPAASACSAGRSTG
jgi:hypothetical protein